MTLSGPERAALLKAYPRHYFVRLVKFGCAGFMAIPKNPEKKDLPIKLMPAMTIDVLHGSTIYLDKKRPELAP